MTAKRVPNVAQQAAWAKTGKWAWVILKDVKKHPVLLVKHINSQEVRLHTSLEYLQDQSEDAPLYWENLGHVAILRDVFQAGQGTVGSWMWATDLGRRRTMIVGCMKFKKKAIHQAFDRLWQKSARLKASRKKGK